MIDWGRQSSYLFFEKSKFEKRESANAFSRFFLCLSRVGFTYMRLHRFYISTPIEAETFEVTNRDLIHQWKNVFRYNVGSQVILFDGRGSDYLAMITSLRNLGATVSGIKKMKSSFVPQRDLWLCVGIAKKDTFEMVAQKATELGVTHLVPVLCERSEKKNLNMERLEKITIEAAEQSGRGDVPTTHPIKILSEVLESTELPKDKIVLHPDGELIADFLGHTNPKRLAVFLGPEGGFSEKEIGEFSSHNIPAISLGTQILRAETAAIAVASLLLL